MGNSYDGSGKGGPASAIVRDSAVLDTEVEHGFGFSVVVAGRACCCLEPALGMR